MWKHLLARGRRFWRVSVGAGLLGAVVLTLRYALRPSAKPKLPDAISPAIFATRILYTSRGQMVYHESGQGAPLVFLHGVYVGASSYEWSKVYPHFAATHQVLAVDLLGFGESERPDVLFSAADHVRALVEFIRAKSGGERASIVASGFGAGFASRTSGIRTAPLAEALQRVLKSSALQSRVLPALSFYENSDSRLVKEIRICGPGKNY
jgi:pimeloyl-ACP methyl ester carboxylesterase